MYSKNISKINYLYGYIILGYFIKRWVRHIRIGRIKLVMEELKDLLLDRFGAKDRILSDLRKCGKFKTYLRFQ